MRGSSLRIRPIAGKEERRDIKDMDARSRFVCSFQLCKNFKFPVM
jgi:hypothetical protein